VRQDEVRPFLRFIAAASFGLGAGMLVLTAMVEVGAWAGVFAAFVVAAFTTLAARAKGGE
jgi:hypothetical protein